MAQTEPIYPGAEGVTVALTGLGDLSGASAYCIYAFKPSGGAMVRWPTAGNATLGTVNGQSSIEYTSIAGTLPDAGDYRLHGYGEKGTWKGYTKLAWLHVAALGER
jgi:hypothetical protein